jgi:hypothetical protein
MQNLSFSIFYAALLVLVFAGCEDQSVTKNISTPSGRTPPPYEGPGSYEGNPGGNPCPYPQIIFKEYIPKDDLYNWKTLAWRITWPAYDRGCDATKIPTVFGLNGSLNSFEYLNNVDPANTHKAIFSLYNDATIVRSNNLGSELNFVNGAPKGSMALVCFELNDQPLWFIQFMVEQAPGGFQTNIYEPDALHEWEYKQGDFLIFQLQAPTWHRWGGIRIVSMEPRIIEVYLAVPNF